jgi:hypothetical protein
MYKFTHPSSLACFDINLTALKGGELIPKRLKYIIITMPKNWLKAGMFLIYRIFYINAIMFIYFIMYDFLYIIISK